MSYLTGLAKLAGWKFKDGAGRVVVIPPTGTLRSYRVVCNAAGRVMSGTAVAPAPVNGQIFLTTNWPAGSRFALFEFSYSAVATVSTDELWASGAFITVNENGFVNAQTMFTGTDNPPNDTPVNASGFQPRLTISPQGPFKLFDLRADDVDVVSTAVGFLASENTGGAPSVPCYVDVSVW